MNRRFMILLLATGVLLQPLLSLQIAFGVLNFPVLTGLLICIALHTTRSRALYTAAWVGLLHDALGLAPLGFSIPFFIGLAAGVNRIRHEVFGDHPITYAILGAAASVLETFYQVIVFALSGLRPISIGLFALRLIGGLVMGLLVVPLVAWIALHLRMMMVQERRRTI